MKLILIVLFFNFTGYAESSKYYCYSYPDKMVWYDKIVFVEGEENKRSIRSLYTKKELYKAYDERDKITSVYYDHPYKNYRIIQLDLSSQPVSYSYGYGYHETPSAFEKSYQIPFTKEALARLNRNPELIKYLPKKPKEKSISYAFFKRRLNCSPLNSIEYSFKLIKLFLIKAGTAG